MGTVSDQAASATCSTRSLVGRTQKSLCEGKGHGSFAHVRRPGDEYGVGGLACSNRPAQQIDGPVVAKYRPVLADS